MQYVKTALRLFSALVVIVATSASEPGASAAMRDQTATVSISIRVGPIAEISTPKGTGFLLRVGGANTDVIQTVLQHAAPSRVPFVLRGNAKASVYVDASERDMSPAGNEMGIARLVSDPSRILNYRINVELEGDNNDVLSGNYQPYESGNSDTFSKYASANVASGPSKGIVSVIPIISETRRPTNGTYSGSVSLTITATE